SSIVAQDDAGAAGGDQLPAEFLKVGAVVVYDADVVADVAAQSDAAASDHDRLAVADQSGILLLGQPIDRPGPALRRTGGELHAPARHVFSLFIWIRRAYCRHRTCCRRNRTGGRLLAFDALRFENKLVPCVIE